MSILKGQVNSSSDFSSFFRVITYNSSVSLQLMYFLFWTKGSYENTNFDTVKCSDKKSKIPHVILQTASQFFFKFFMTPQCHEIKLICTFLGQTLYTLHKRGQSKCKFYRLFKAWIKIHLILVIFETKNKFFFKFCTASEI